MAHPTPREMMVYLKPSLFQTSFGVKSNSYLYVVLDTYSLIQNKVTELYAYKKCDINLVLVWAIGMGEYFMICRTFFRLGQLVCV